MHLVHIPHVRHVSAREVGRPALCPECGHPGASVAHTAVRRALRLVRPARECYYAMFEYSVLRDESCGCRSSVHAG